MQLKEHKQRMRGNIAALLHTPLERVNVKARTHEEVRVCVCICEQPLKCFCCWDGTGI
jgi:2C-methyl-D-erythritol 2,4-cyclodiphosphate synthase